MKSAKTKSEREPIFHFHWQSLAEKSRKQWKYAHGRCWFAIFQWFFRLEWNLWSDHCHLSAETGGDEEQFQISCAIPPFAAWFAIQLPSKSWLRKISPEETRETRLSMFEWSIRLVLWGREHEWRRNDPWWIRGVSLDLKDLFLGKIKHTSTEIAERQSVQIPLDGRIYEGVAKFERCIWKRRRWFMKIRDSVWIDMLPGHGLPHSGKGENSWDCGDDAVCGFGVSDKSVDDAIQHGIDLVTKYRQKYGNPSTLVNS